MSTSSSDPTAEAERQPAAADVPAPAESLAVARVSAAELAASGALDSLFEQIDGGQVQLSGDGGLLPELIKAVLERGLQAELTGHLGYEKGDPAAGLYANSRNGSSDKTVASEVGNVPLQIPRDREGTFTPRLVPKGQRRVGGLDEMIISLYAGGMTLRDIRHHLVSTIGTELSHETLSRITDEIGEEILAWQSRPLEALYPVVYLDALVVKVLDGEVAYGSFTWASPRHEALESLAQLQALAEGVDER